MSHSDSYWSHRGYLPHFHSSDAIQALTFRLADSLPAHAIKRLMLGDKAESDAEYRARLEEYLDAGYGSCILKNDVYAKPLQDSLLHCHNVRYHLHSWTIMPNHVHVLVQFKPGIDMGDEVKAWKASVSREVKKQTGRAGQIWFEDYWDRYMRDQKHYHNSISYIDGNPVKAGLVQVPNQWRWGSSGYGFNPEEID